MLISEVVRRSGVPATTLRYYESVGLIGAERGINGYRDYDVAVLDRLSFIHGAKQLELSLPEIVELFGAVEGESCTQVREVLRPKLTERLREVDERLATLQDLRGRLAAATRRVTACPDSADGCRTECVLLDDHAPACSGAAPVQGPEQ